MVFIFHQWGGRNNVDVIEFDKHQIGCDFVLFNLSHTDKLRKILQTLSAFSSAAGA